MAIQSAANSTHGLLIILIYKTIFLYPVEYFKKEERLWTQPFGIGVGNTNETKKLEFEKRDLEKRQFRSNQL